MKKLLFTALLIPFALASCFNNEEECGSGACIDAATFSGAFYFPSVTTTKAGTTYTDVQMSVVSAMDLQGNWRTVFSSVDLHDAQLSDIMETEGSLPRFRFFDISPDGNCILIGYINQQERMAVREFDVTTRTFSSIILTSGYWGLQSMAYSNLGGKIAYVEDVEVYSLNVVNRNGTGKIAVCGDLEEMFGDQVVASSNFGYLPAFTPDDSRVMVSSDAGIALFEISAGAATKTVWTREQENTRITPAMVEHMEGAVPFSASRALFVTQVYDSPNQSYTINAVNYSNSGAAATPAGATLYSSPSPNVTMPPATLTMDGKLVGCVNYNSNTSTPTFLTWSFDGNSTLSGKKSYNYPQNVLGNEAIATFKAINKAYFESCPMTVIPPQMT